MTDLDAHIENPQYRKETLKLHCRECEVEWLVQGLREYGTWQAYNDDDLNCPVCGEEGKE